MNEELVSVLVPTYNRAELIAETIQSALLQTHSNIEVIVVDNASTDGTWAVIESLTGKDHRIKAFRNKTNIGPVRNWLRCVSEANGVFGKILWSDDLLHPDFLSQAISAIKQPGVGFVYSPAVVFSGDKPTLGKRYFDIPPSGVRPSSEFIQGSLLSLDYPKSPGCALFRMTDMRDYLIKDVPNRIGSDFSMHAIGNDLLLFLMVAARYPYFVKLSEPLSYFRAHSGSISESANHQKLDLHYDVAKAWFVATHPLPASWVERFNGFLAVHLKIYRKNEFGLKLLDDFYPETGARPIAWRRLPFDLLTFLAQKIFRYLK
jgi:glycosyltransferase involved in cell wall biosynthesis